MKLLHLSDVHVHHAAWPPPLFSGGWRRVLAQVELRGLRRGYQFLRAPEVLARIAEEATAEAVDHVVLSGDLTTLALEEEFRAARRALEPLIAQHRITLVPGNHDRYTPAARRQRRFEAHFGDLLQSDLPEYCVDGAFPLVHLVGEALAVVGLDSALVPSIPGFSYGRVGRRQREALARILADPRVQGRRIVVTLHHGPYRHTGRRDRPSHGLHDARAVLDLCAAGGVDALLHGHLHERFRLRCPRRGIEVFGAGSSTQAGLEGYWLLDLSGEGIRAEAREVRLPEPAPAEAPAVLRERGAASSKRLAMPSKGTGSFR
ncbi:MAG: metallophosphoesterase [Deltaproteobacteria bacterium]|nr:MAG: metallophosphoesterase [Deltaproteobacteria bacterium]